MEPLVFSGLKYVFDNYSPVVAIGLGMLVMGGAFYLRVKGVKVDKSVSPSKATIEIETHLMKQNAQLLKRLDKAYEDIDLLRGTQKCQQCPY